MLQVNELAQGATMFLDYCISNLLPTEEKVMKGIAATLQEKCMVTSMSSLWSVHVLS